MHVGNLTQPSEHQLVRQRFALLCEAQQHGGLILQELKTGDYFVCVETPDPSTGNSQLMPIARLLTEQHAK
jgi:hypothetical protein